MHSVLTARPLRCPKSALPRVFLSPLSFLNSLVHAYNQVVGLQQENSALKNEVAFLRDQLQKAQTPQRGAALPTQLPPSQSSQPQPPSLSYTLSTTTSANGREVLMIDDETLLQVLQQKEREIEILKQELLLKESEVDALREEREQFFEMQKNEEELIHIALNSSSALGSGVAASIPSSASSSSTFNLDLLMSDRTFPASSSPSLYDPPPYPAVRPTRNAYQPLTNPTTQVKQERLPSQPQQEPPPTGMQIDKGGETFTGFLLQSPLLSAQPQQAGNDYIQFARPPTPQQQATGWSPSAPTEVPQPQQQTQQPEQAQSQQQNTPPRTQDTQISSVREPRAPWVCSFCTLTNNFDAKFCAVCARPR